ncbi:MAG: efflux RND transporter permease subunit [Reyranella sp.]|uniref:efflux RND transporter permease subunit n=1 Tax=Reyranella sp. TaxID=1929291 RepID=UPI001ACE71DC|nr:efflux RND transporter permease subunit [Reyranella sp.]MBN9089018.1 efflux RND transporter permease subunit [Reyranella sp.]
MGGGPQAALIGFAIRFRGVVIALVAMVFGYGVYSLAQARYDVFPEFAPPQITIQTEAVGLAPEQVEVLVTQAIENSLNGMPGLKSLRSISIQGLSAITGTFDPSSDVYRARQMVTERLAALETRLPSGIGAPTMTPLTSSTSLVLVAGLTSNERSLMELRTLADWTIRPRLLAVPGVGKVDVFGGEVKSLQIQVRPDDLTRFGIGLDEVLSAARRATGVRGAGFIDGANQRIVLQSEGQSITPEALGRTVLVNHGGASVLLSNVATVVNAPQPVVGAAAIDGQSGVVLNIHAQFGANTLEVTRLLEKAFDDLRPGLTQSGVVLRDDLFRPADFIRTATENVWSSLLIGAALVVIVLFLFLFDARTAVISCLAIPLSLLAAVLVLQRLGLALNTMVLGGLAIAVGVVVDDAVVDIENIARRLRENARLPMPRPGARVVMEACLEVRAAVVYATFAVVLVVFPIVMLSGVAGRLFAPLGIAYALAVIASLLVTLTAIPALAMTFLGARPVGPGQPPLVAWLKRRYERLLHHVVTRSRLAIVATVLGTLLGFGLVPLLGQSFIPQLNEGHFIVHMTALPGTSAAESLRLGGLVTKALQTVPAVRSVAQRVGRSQLSEDTSGPHYSEFAVSLHHLSGEAEAAEGQIRKAVETIPGANFAIFTFLSERMDEVLSGYTAPVVVNIFGDDLDLLDRKAQEAADVLRQVRGAADVQIQSPPGLPKLVIKLRPLDVEHWGFDSVDVLDAIRTAFGGETVGQVYEGNRVFPVIVIVDPASRASIARVGDLPLRSRSGTYVPLRQLADIYHDSGRYQVAHQAAQRLQTITANVTGRDVISFAREAKARLGAKLALPAGFYVALGGQAEAQARSQRDLLVNSIIAGAGIVLLLSIVTRRMQNLALVLANSPFALVGGVLAVLASGGTLSLGSMVGFVALFGLTLRNSILMIAHYQHLVATEGRTWDFGTAIEGAADRLAPILMTSLVTALGVLPLAIGMSEPGREIEGPMALVMLGGLVSSTALNLLLLPALALRYGRFEAPDLEIEPGRELAS